MSDLLGQYSDLRLLALLAPLLRSRNFVDIGAENGAVAESLFSCGLDGYLFEPLPKHAGYLEELASRHGGFFYDYAISNVDDKRDLNIAVDEHGVELDFYHSLIAILPQPKFRHDKRISVQCHRIDTLVLKGVLASSIGILKTDTEGNDYFVLLGLGDTRPEVVVCEFFSDGVYAGWDHARPELLIELMKGLGYRRYVAIKRWGCWEMAVSGPAAFQRGDWGNLFFFDAVLFDAAEDKIKSFLSECNQPFFDGVEHQKMDREAKEVVIQQLLAEKGHKLRLETGFVANLRKFF
jgi:FkbM family methyltransferase